MAEKNPQIDLSTEYFGAPLSTWLIIIVSVIGLIVGIIAVLRRR